MEQWVAEALAKRKQAADIEDLFETVKANIEFSRSKMSTYYDQWDANDASSKNRRVDDTQDKKAKARKEPRKMVVPLTAAQVDTFVSFCYMVFTQRERVFELFGSGVEDEGAARIAEALLERDLDKSDFRGTQLLQFLYNVAKFNIGVFKHTWCEESYTVIEEEVIPGMDGLGPSVQEIERVVTSFMGNKVVNVSPYRWFPDPRFPLSRFQEGEFCGSEDEYSTMRLRGLANQGLVAGLEHVQETDLNLMGERRISFHDYTTESSGPQTLDDTYILTEVEKELIPADTMIDGKPLGEETQPCKYLIWYLNDDRIVRISKQGYAHGNYLYRIGQYITDDVEFIGPSMPEIIERMQDAVSWFINSRITSVKKVIDNKFVVDPRGIDIKALKNRDPVLLLKPNAQGGDVRRYITQLNVSDVTTGHVADAQNLLAFARESTGLSENLLGQYSSGRRSAREAGAVNANAAARIKKVVDSIWHSGLKRLGQDMIDNHREFLDAEQLVKVIGPMKLQNPSYLAGATQFLQVTKEDIQGHYDFKVYDGTLPSEKYAQADGLQNLLEILLSNPEVAMQFGYTPEVLHEILIETLTLRGVKNVERFRILAQQAGQPGAGAAPVPGAPVQPAQTQPGLPVPM